MQSLKSVFFGYITFTSQKFDDSKLFSKEFSNSMFLSKIKIWYGHPKPGNSAINLKTILGIQCVYTDIITGEKIISEPHHGELFNDYFEEDEIELKNGDYFKRIFIDANLHEYKDSIGAAIIYIKLETRDKNFIEIGEYIEGHYLDRFEFRFLDKPHVIQTFFGRYDDYGVRALGFNYISRENLIFNCLKDILELRYYLNHNDEERKKWENPEIKKTLSDKMKAIINLCFLEERAFLGVVKYLIPF